MKTFFNYDFVSYHLARLIRSLPQPDYDSPYIFCHEGVLLLQALLKLKQLDAIVEVGETMLDRKDDRVEPELTQNALSSVIRVLCRQDNVKHIQRAVNLKVSLCAHLIQYKRGMKIMFGFMHVYNPIIMLFFPIIMLHFKQGALVQKSITVKKNFGASNKGFTTWLAPCLIAICSSCLYTVYKEVVIRVSSYYRTVISRNSTSSYTHHLPAACRFWEVILSQQ